MLSPELVESNEFKIGLPGIKETTKDKSPSTDYYTYMRNYQEKNPIMSPFKNMMRNVTSCFKKKENTKGLRTGAQMDPFRMSERDSKLLEKIKRNISFDVDKKT